MNDEMLKVQRVLEFFGDDGELQAADLEPDDSIEILKPSGQSAGSATSK
jgi:hypothetical protein